MKKRYFLLCLLASMTLNSCQDFLETTPTDFLAPETYYETEAQLNFARASVYHTLGAGQLYGSYANYLLGWMADEGYMNRSTLNSAPVYYAYTSSETYSSAYWTNLYNGINRANVLLANLDKNPGIDQQYRDQIRGEVLFLRGYYYFLLVQYYGGVPLKLSPTNSVAEVDIPRASIREVYDQILQDMTAAEALVPGIRELGFGGRVSKSAVRGILARVNLHMAGQPLKDASRLAEVVKWTKMVMDDAEAGHDLNPSYSQVFINYAQDKYDIKESIWEVEFWGNRSDSYTETGNVGYINGPSTNNLATGRGDAYMSITSNHYDVYEPGDLRKGWNIVFFAYNSTGAGGSKTFSAATGEATSEANKFVRHPGKWRREYELLLPKFPQQTPINMPLLRYSDVLLMFAEASGPTAEAIAAVNKVRRRSWSTGIRTITVTDGGSGYTSAPTVSFSGNGGAGATATVQDGKVTAITLNRDAVTLYQSGQYTSAPTITLSGGGGSGATAVATIHSLAEADLSETQTASPQAFLQAIQEERMRELNFEGLRKADLLRWGIFVETMQDVANKFRVAAPTSANIKAYANVEPKHLLMPIPSSETNVNEAIIQNPGWE